MNSTPSSPLAVAIDSTCIFSSCAFSRERLATPQRQPSRRNGPTKKASSSAATPDDFRILRAIINAQPHACHGLEAPIREKRGHRYSGISKRSPALGCPGGTIKVVSRPLTQRALPGAAGESGQVITTRFSSRAAAKCFTVTLRVAIGAKPQCRHGAACESLA